MIDNLFYFWSIFNLLVGIWEVYAFINRKQLVLSKDSIWKKISNGTTTIHTFWIDAWSEYCKVDSRYIKTYSKYQYVWFFEILNFVLAILFILSILYLSSKKKTSFLKTILIISIINCFCYYLTLVIEIYNNNNNNIILENIKTYATTWMIPVYYLICSIWLIVPTILYIKL